MTTSPSPATAGITRRTAIRQGATAAAALAIGLPVVSAPAAANHPRTLDVEVHPAINPRSKGLVPTTVLRGSDPAPADILADPNFSGFKLGPRGSSVDANGADAVRWRLKGNGDLKVHFDPKTATRWFERGDTLAVLSATNVAWGTDDVRVVGRP